MRDWMIEKILAPSRRLDLILDLDVLRDTNEVRSTLIYETLPGKRMIVSQTMPPILTSRVGQVIEATYLVRNHESGDQERYGFRTKILKFLKDYRLNRKTSVQALALAYPLSEIRRTHARLLHRVELVPEYGLVLAVKELGPEEEVVLLDISLGGILFCYKGYTELQAGRRLRIDLLGPGIERTLFARVVRVFERAGSRLLFVGCRFSDPSPEQTEEIRGLVQELMRRELKHRSGLDKGRGGEEGEVGAKGGGPEDKTVLAEAEVPTFTRISPSRDQ